MAGKVEVDNRGHVKNVCKEFSIKNDETLAYRLQDQEYYEHFDLNRKQRQHIRSDIPVAKTAQNNEYQELLKRHEMLERLEKDDEAIAREIQQKYLEEVNKLKKLQQEADEEYARNLEIMSKNVFTENNNINNDINGKNIIIADEMDKLNLNEENSLMTDDHYFAKLQEEQDYEIARFLQEQEEKEILKNQVQSAKTQKSTNKNSVINNNDQYASEDYWPDSNNNNLYHSNANVPSTSNNNNRIINGPFIIDKNLMDPKTSTSLEYNSKNNANYHENSYQSLPLQKQSDKSINISKASSLYILNKEQQKIYLPSPCNNVQTKFQTITKNIDSDSKKFNLCDKDEHKKSKNKSNSDAKRSISDVNNWKHQQISSNQINRNQVFQNSNRAENCFPKNLISTKKCDQVKENERCVQTLNSKHIKDRYSTEKQFDLNVLNMTDNILATIDPTFRRRFSLKDLNANKKEKTMHTIANTKTLNMKTGYNFTLSKYADDYVPVQGQRRTKTLNNRKKSASQCLQQ